MKVMKRVLPEEHPDTLNPMNNLANLYRRQGRYDEAELLMVKTLEIRKRVLGEEHPHTLDSVNNLALLYAEQGHYDAAQPLYVRTLEIQKLVLGEEHPSTLNSMGNPVAAETRGRGNDHGPPVVARLVYGHCGRLCVSKGVLRPNNAASAS